MNPRRRPKPKVTPALAAELPPELAAAFEARHHFMAYSRPAVFSFPKGMRAFEMVGWRGPVVWKADDGRFSMPLERCYEQGVGFLGVDGISLLLVVLTGILFPLAFFTTDVKILGVYAADGFRKQ